MRISDRSQKAIAPSQASGVTSAGDSGRRAGSAVGSGAADQVQLSSLSALMAAAYGDTPAHAAKLSSLTATVSSGSYQVDTGILSNSIIEASLVYSGGNYT
jgi:anti-sigma28 factor (negative regulator of flagellin synthesis)